MPNLTFPPSGEGWLLSQPAAAAIPECEEALLDPTLQLAALQMHAEEEKLARARGAR